MRSFNFAVPDLAALYTQPYNPEMLQWRALGALDKADNIETMCKAVDGRITSVLEVGCGTGAVLQQLAARHVGSTFRGIDIGSRSGEKRQIQGDITISDYDGKNIPFEDASFDLVYATHVLEHVVEERRFLLELRRVTQQYVYVEVPCELHMRTNHSSLQATLLIGHINHYSFWSFAQKLETAGLRIIELEIFDNRYGTYRFANKTWWKAAFKMVVRRSLLALNRGIASRLFTFHVGALCIRSTPLTIE